MDNRGFADGLRLCAGTHKPVNGTRDCPGSGQVTCPDEIQTRRSAGVALFMGGETTPSLAVVQSAGSGYRLKGSLLKGEFERGGTLQAAGLIHYSRGKITVLDRPQLEARVCECYAVVNREYDRLLPEIAAT